MRNNMCLKFKHMVVLGILLLLSYNAKAVTPSWTVQANKYTASMSVIGTVVLTDEESTDNSAVVAAFVNNECRGVASPVYDANTGHYSYYMLVYGDLNGEQVNFKYYDSVNDKIETLINEVLFEIDGSIGSDLEPYVWSKNVLNKAEIVEFDVPGSITSEIGADYVNVIFDDKTNIAEAIAKFKLSPGAFAKVTNAVQRSEHTSNNFSTSLLYNITSGDRKFTKTYTVNAFQSKMNFNARVIIDDVEVNASKDTLIAIIDGVVRGKTDPVFDNSIKKYRFNLKVFGQTSGQTINFKYYIHSTGQTVDLIQSKSFNASSVVGTNEDPVMFSNTPQSVAGFSNFSISEQSQPTISKSASHYKVIVSENRSRNNMVATFRAPESAVVRVNGKVQYSGITANDFTKSIVYSVSSGDNSITKEYTVDVFSTYMEVISRVVINEVETTNAEDTLYAVIDGKVRDKSVAYYDAVSKRYRFKSKVYHNVEDEIISFKHFSASSGITSDLLQTVKFKNGTVVGSDNDPFTFSDTELKVYTFKSFGINGQMGRTYYKGDNIIKVVVPESTDKSKLTATFDVDEAAIVKIGDVVQYSNISENDFSSDVTYKVNAATDLTSKEYVVQVLSTSMKQISRVVIDNKETATHKDTLYALVDGVVRAKTTADLVEDLNKYRYDIKIYDNLDGQEITFEYFSFSKGERFPLIQTTDFEISKTEGTNADPFVFSNNNLTENTLETFTLKGQMGETIYEGDVIKVIIPEGSDKAKQTAVFKVDDGATVRVNGSVQYTGLTVNDFTDHVTYEVISGDGLTTNEYTIIVIESKLSLLQEPQVITPNGDGDNDYWELEEKEKFRECTFYIYNARGQRVYTSLGYRNDWNGTHRGCELPTGSYYYVIKSPEGKFLHKGGISLIR